MNLLGTKKIMSDYVKRPNMNYPARKFRSFTVIPKSFQVLSSSPQIQDCEDLHIREAHPSFAVLGMDNVSVQSTVSWGDSGSLASGEPARGAWAGCGTAGIGPQPLAVRQMKTSARLPNTAASFPYRDLYTENKPAVRPNRQTGLRRFPNIVRTINSFKWNARSIPRSLPALRMQDFNKRIPQIHELEEPRVPYNTPEPPPSSSDTSPASSPRVSEPEVRAHQRNYFEDEECDQLDFGREDQVTFRKKCS